MNTPETPPGVDDFESALAREIMRGGRSFPARDLVVGFSELVVTAGRAYNEAGEGEFIEAFQQALEPKEHILGPLFASADAELDTAKKWLKRLETQQGQRFAKRFFGSARADRFKAAAAEDMKVIVPAVRKSMPNFLTVAYAVDACLPTAVGEESEASPSLSVLLRANHWLGAVEDNDFAFVPAEQIPPTDLAVEVAETASSLRQETSQAALDRLADAETPLIRKLSGAYDALDMSSDGVSQAANSVVELIDRMFRLVFTKEEVMGWIESYAPAVDHPSLVYSKPPKNKQHPTTRAKALCFISAGRDPGDSYDLYAIVAGAFVLARRTLEKYKHADTGPEAPTELKQALAMVEAAIVVVFRLAWLGLDDDERDALLGRLRAA